MFPKKLITAGALSLFLPLMFMRVAAGQELEPLEYAESFDDGIPVTWTIIDGYEDGISWEWYDPVDDPIGAPFTMPSIIMDSLISSNLMDEIIISPGYDLSRCQGAITLQFANCFMYYALNLHEIGDVDVSADGGATWTNVLRMYNNHFGPEIRQLDVTSIASGATDFKTRFHYYNARQEYWWFVDDVKVSCMATPEEPEMTLDCDGFAEPMHQVVTIKGRRPILPLKATLTDSETGVVITDVDLENPPVAIVAIASESHDGEVITPGELIDITEATDGNIFEYNPATEQWYFHLPVSDFAAGTYVVTMESTDKEQYEFSPKCEAVFNR